MSLILFIWLYVLLSRKCVYLMLLLLDDFVVILSVFKL